MFQFWLDFVNHLLQRDHDDSSAVAAGRLKGTVFLDRLSLSPATLDLIRNDVVRSISRYLVIDETAMTLAVQAQGRTVALAASIPVVRPRSEPAVAPIESAPSPAGREQAVTTSMGCRSASRPTRTLTVAERARARMLRRKRQGRKS